MIQKRERERERERNSKAAQSKKEDKEISGEDHGVKRNADEIAEGSPRSERSRTSGEKKSSLKRS